MVQDTKQESIFTEFDPGATSKPTPAMTELTKSETGKKKRTTKPNKRSVAAVNPAPAEPPKTEPTKKKTRKKRTVPKVRTPRSMKLGVDTMLHAMAGLKPADGALVEKLIGVLNGAGKGQRKRVLVALDKIFA